MFNENVWPSSYDDREIDDIIWSEIKDSTSRGDFVSYLLHRPQRAQYLEAAQTRLKEIDGGDQMPIGYPRAAVQIQAMADKGSAAAMFHMGKMHVLGIGLPQDIQTAEAWYQRAIAAGERRACCNMGWIYLYGFDEIPPNKEQAFRLLSLGAESGVIVAKASVGLMLLTGDGCVANQELGLQMLEVAFAAGYNNAANHLSDAYFSGKHVPHDIELGHEWLSRAAARGDERTMAILGHYLVTGSHGKTDVEQGLALLHQSIDKEYLQAYLWLGNLYRHGHGVDRDPMQARHWFERGAAAGNAGCEPALASLMLEISPPPSVGSSALH